MNHDNPVSIVKARYGMARLQTRDRGDLAALLDEEKRSGLIPRDSR
ncbi:MAG TPA: hypothetical protein PKY15_05850 [Methanoregulaceae archaeon]|nr:hypothetical protein [Methanoregulaceae archaeon]HQC12867.1 hypothetical protein [Methanoregulaceae archaeon]